MEFCSKSYQALSQRYDFLSLCKEANLHTWCAFLHSVSLWSSMQVSSSIERITKLLFFISDAITLILDCLDMLISLHGPLFSNVLSQCAARFVTVNALFSGSLFQPEFPALWVINYFPYCNPYPTNETLLNTH